MKDALREHASMMLSCSQLQVRSLSLGTPHAPMPVYFAEGCGQRLVYAERADEYMGDAPPYPDLYLFSRTSLISDPAPSRTGGPSEPHSTPPSSSGSGQPPTLPPTSPPSAPLAPRASVDPPPALWR